MGKNVRVRKLVREETAVHRDVRLRALKESPESFGTTFADASAEPMSYWEELTESVTARDRHVMFVADEDGTVLGSAYGLVDADVDVGRVGGMWVDSDRRNQGLGAALLEAVFEWARERGFGRLRLWAPTHVPAALALYERAGFTATGAVRPLPTDATLEICEMECKL